MAASMHWKVLAVLASLTITSMGCSSDDSGADDGNGDGDDSGEKDGGKLEIPDGEDDGDGDEGGDAGANNGSDANLGAGVAGKPCSADAECTEGGSCAAQLPVGVLGQETIAAPGGYCTAQCTNDTVCGSGGACVGGLEAMGMSTPGQCGKLCSAQTDCRDGYFCSAGVNVDGGNTGIDIPAQPSTCQPRPSTGTLGPDVAGSACASASDCAGTNTECATRLGAVVQGIGGITAPGGYCTATCITDSDCGTGGTCVVGPAGGAGSCYEACEAEADCTREVYDCLPVGAKGGKACQPSRAQLADNVAGTACAADGACGAGTCASSLPSGQASQIGMRADEAAVDGYCTSTCLDSTSCGAGGVCVGALALAALEGTCFAGCADSADCREHYECEMLTGQFGITGGQVCVPDGTSGTGVDAGMSTDDAGTGLDGGVSSDAG